MLTASIVFIPFPQVLRVDKNYPYRHKIIEQVIKSMFFTPRKAAADAHHSRFVSSLPNHPVAKNELEVPQPMVALVATAVRDLPRLSDTILTDNDLDVRCDITLGKTERT